MAKYTRKYLGGKICHDCGEFKTFNEFACYWSPGKSTQRRSDYCMECELAMAKRTKRCSRCGELRCLLDFRHSGISLDGFANVCNVCAKTNKKDGVAGRKPWHVRSSAEILKDIEDTRRAEAEAKEQEERVRQQELESKYICQRCGTSKPKKLFIDLYPAKEGQAPRFRRICDVCQRLEKDKPKDMPLDEWLAEKRRKHKAELEARMDRIIAESIRTGISYGRIVANERRKEMEHG